VPGLPQASEPEQAGGRPEQGQESVEGTYSVEGDKVKMEVKFFTDVGGPITWTIKKILVRQPLYSFSRLSERRK
jgi:hypothetical protein